jgi:hypothetical protein
VPYVSKNASKEQDRITPEVLESLATFREEHGESVASVYRRAARTIRALQEAEAARAFADIGLDKWRERALAAEQDREALRAEISDLLEIERCKRSIEAAEMQWTQHEPREKHHPIAIHRIHECLFREEFGEWGAAATVADWQSAERAAWEHAADPFRERIEAAGFELKLRFAEGGNNPIEIVRCASIDDNLWEVSYHAGDLGGSPTFDALEKAAAWAEAYPANAPKPDDQKPASDDRLWKQRRAPCSCGHVHSGCAGCAYALTRFCQEPCRGCATMDPKRQCLWTPKPSPEFAPVDTAAARASKQPTLMD